MKAVFVAGTDTGVGKTIVAGCLLRYLLSRGLAAITQKWVQTGSATFFSSDVKTHLRIAGQRSADIKDHLSRVLLYYFKAACSPHLAAEREGRKISSARIKRSFDELKAHFDFVIAEGAGGVLVPYDRRHLLIDIVKELDLPVLLVSENRLGAIHQTLAAVEALKARKIRLLGIVLNNIKKTDEMVLKDNPRIIRELTGETILGILPRCPSLKSVYRAFLPLGRRISEVIQ